MYYSKMTAQWVSDSLQVLKERAVQTADMCCEYRSPQFDGGTQQGRMIQCPNKAAMWTDRGLRCDDHKGD